MERNITTNVGRLAAWFAVLAMVKGCAEAPRTSDDGEVEEVVGETKDARKDACPSETPDSEEPEALALDAERAEEEEVDVPRREEEDVEEVEVVSDSGVATALDAAHDPIAATTLDEPDAGAEASRGDAALAYEACDSNPCQHGGTCSGDAGQYACMCPDGYTGQHCELKVCGNVTIGSRADVEAARECAEVRGSVTIYSTGLIAIGADDFPFLTSIAGDLMITGAQEGEGPLLESVTLANLRAVEGSVVVLGVATVGYGSSGPLKELHLPALERIGARGALGLLVYQASLGVLDLPVLTTIQGGVALHTLLELCSAEFEGIEYIGGDLVLQDVPRLSATQFEPLRASVAGESSEALLGCCASSSDDRLACEMFTQSARVLYCTGC